MPINEGIVAAKAAIDVSKILLELANRPKLDADAVRQKISELLIHLVNSQTALSELQNENQTLRQQLDDRMALKAIEADMEFQIDGHFYIRKSERQHGLIPYCPICWSSNKILVHLTRYSGPGSFTCAIHNTMYGTQAQAAWEEREARRDAETFRRENEISPI